MDCNIKIKEETKALWVQSFDDSIDFVDFYFNFRYNDKINIFIKEDGKVVSALQMIPYSMTLWQSVVSVSYISGACTDRKYRNRGIMRTLLRKAHRKMYNDNVYISSLIPGEDWLIGFYEKSDYCLCFCYGEEKLLYEKSEKSSGIYIKRSTISSDEIFEFFDRKMRERECSFLHSKSDFDIVVRDIQLENGSLFVAYDNGEINGLAFTLTYLDKLYVKELLYENNIVKQQLVNSICTYYSIDSFYMAVPSKENVAKRGMARIINVKKVLLLYAAFHQKERLYVEVYDDEIKENNGYFNVENGNLTTDKKNNIIYKRNSIKELTFMLLSGEYPFMSLMLD